MNWNKETKILEKVDTIIAKLPPRSKQRAEFLKKREQILDLLIDKKKKELKKLLKKTKKK